MQQAMGLSNWETRYCQDKTFLGGKKFYFRKCIIVLLLSSHRCVVGWFDFAISAGYMQGSGPVPLSYVVQHKREDLLRASSPFDPPPPYHHPTHPRPCLVYYMLSCVVGMYFIKPN